MGDEECEEMVVLEVGISIRRTKRCGQRWLKSCKICHYGNKIPMANFLKIISIVTTQVLETQLTEIPTTTLRTFKRFCSRMYKIALQNSFSRSLSFTPSPSLKELYSLSR